ncbi:MAG: hypothetical protein R3224_10985 [Balneolaceae bacterium]|nr:hypothetical protein [Balneolaceae bacterium]
MKSLATLMLSFILVSNAPLHAQDRQDNGRFSIEVEPVAYILGGAGATAGWRIGSWTYSLEAFGGLSVPESLHGNNGFGTSLRGIEFQAERFIQGTGGFFVGPEFGLSRLEVTWEATGQSKTHTHYSIGVRGGYHWETGLGNLYLSPVAGFSYALNAEDIRIQNRTFESASGTPFATVGIGWSF